MATSTFVAFEVQEQQKRLVLFSAVTVTQKRARVLCNKRHTSGRQSLYNTTTVSSRAFHGGIQSQAVAQNKRFEIRECSRLSCHLMVAFRAALRHVLQTKAGVPVNFIMFLILTAVETSLPWLRGLAVYSPGP